MLRLASGEWALLDWEFTGLFLPGFDLAMLSVLLAGTPGAADLLEEIACRTCSEDAYLVNLAVVLSRERRIHLTLPPGAIRCGRHGCRPDRRRLVAGQGTALGGCRPAVIRASWALDPPRTGTAQ